jgi:hypothetical protein
MRPLASVLLLAALSSPAVAADQTLALDAPVVLLADRVNTLEVADVFGPATANLVASVGSGPNACPPPLAGDCLDIPDPAVLIGTEPVDAAGVATFTVRPPGSFADGVVQLQGAAFSGGVLELTQPVTLDILDPVGDEDFDGLDNEKELQLGTDLFRADSDDDGVGDAVELANGTDPLTCDSPADTDGDGVTDCEEIELGTGLRLVDTDGDGFDDFQEVIVFGFSPQNNNFRFNPRIADTPRLEVDLVSAPAVAVLFTASDGTELSHDVERSQSSASSVTVGREDSNSHAIEFAVTEGTEVTVGAEVSFPDGFGANVSSTVSFETSLATTNETSFSFSQEQTQENEEGLAIAEGLARTQGTELTGGVLAVTANVRNTGDIAFTLTNLSISANMTTPGNEDLLEPVGNLTFDTTFNSFPVFSYGPGQANGPFVFLNDGLDLGTTQALLADATNLNIRVSAYEMVDGDGRSFTHNETDILSRTATVIIDYEGENTLLDSERHQVATNTDPAVLRVSAQEAMTETLQMPYELDDDGKLVSIRDVANSDARNGFWYIVHASTDGLVDRVDLYGPEDDYDFSEIELKSGDTIQMVFVEDVDRDGLGRRQEALYGTDIDVADTDGDGLLDGEEINDTKTDPLLADTDDDGLGDGEEIGRGSDPFDRNTDGDCFVDGEEDTFSGDLLVADTDVCPPNGPGDFTSELDRQTALGREILWTTRTAFPPLMNEAQNVAIFSNPTFVDELSIDFNARAASSSSPFFGQTIHHQMVYEEVDPLGAVVSAH